LAKKFFPEKNLQMTAFAPKRMFRIQMLLVVICRLSFLAPDVALGDHVNVLICIEALVNEVDLI